MWIAPKCFWVRLLFTIIWLHIYHQYVTVNKSEAQLESLKIYFDEKEDITLDDIIEKIRKLHKSYKVYFSQVTTQLRISLVLPATNAARERSTSILRRIKNWLRMSITHQRLKHCMLLAIYKKMTDKLSLIDVAVNEFCFGSSRLLDHFFPK